MNGKNQSYTFDLNYYSDDDLEGMYIVFNLADHDRFFITGWQNGQTFSASASCSLNYVKIVY